MELPSSSFISKPQHHATGRHPSFNISAFGSPLIIMTENFEAIFGKAASSKDDCGNVADRHSKQDGVDSLRWKPVNDSSRVHIVIQEKHF
ncbi:Uncharacterised protein g5928 [Pycnogonum litorale]